MKQQLWFSVAVLASTLTAAPGCAFFGKNAPVVPRYFAPEVETPAKSSETRPSSDKRLRLGRIQAGTHLHERMAYRTSTEEVGYYMERRWTERPEIYLRRALSRSLFEVRGVTRAVSGAAPTLEAELVAFDEIKGTEHKVRVQIVMSLDDVTMGSMERTITVEQEVESSDKDDPQPVVQALGRALSDAVAQICDLVVERLAQMPPLDPAPTPPAGTTTTTLTTTTAPTEATEEPKKK
jgi:cholesterol transport system auxiliary component